MPFEGSSKERRKRFKRLFFNIGFLNVLFSEHVIYSVLQIKQFAVII